MDIKRTGQPVKAGFFSLEVSGKLRLRVPFRLILKVGTATLIAYLIASGAINRETAKLILEVFRHG